MPGVEARQIITIGKKDGEAPPQDTHPDAKVIPFPVERTRPSIEPSQELSPDAQASFAALPARERTLVQKILERARNPQDRTRAYRDNKSELLARVQSQIDSLKHEDTTLEEKARKTFDEEAADAKAAMEAQNLLLDIAPDKAWKLIQEQEKALGNKKTQMKKQRERLQKKQAAVREQMEKVDAERVALEEAYMSAQENLDTVAVDAIREHGLVLEKERAALRRLDINGSLGEQNHALNVLDVQIKAIIQKRTEAIGTVAEKTYAGLLDELAARKQKLEAVQQKTQSKVDVIRGRIAKKELQIQTLARDLSESKRAEMVRQGYLKTEKTETNETIEKASEPRAAEMAATLSQELKTDGVELDLDIPDELADGDFDAKDIAAIAYDEAAVQNLPKEKQDRVLGKLADFVIGFVAGERVAKVLKELGERPRKPLGEVVKAWNAKHADKKIELHDGAGHELSEPAIMRRMTKLLRDQKKSDAKGDERVLDSEEIRSVREFLHDELKQEKVKQAA